MMLSLPTGPYAGSPFCCLFAVPVPRTGHPEMDMVRVHGTSYYSRTVLGKRAAGSRLP